MAWVGEVGVYASGNALARIIRIAGIEATSQISNNLKSGHLARLDNLPSLIAGGEGF